MFDIEIEKIKKKKYILFLGLFNIKSQAIFKKIKNNANFKIYVCYKFDKEKEIVNNNKNITLIPFDDLGKFLEFSILSESTLDYIIYGLNFLKSEINDQDYQTISVMKYLNFLILDQIAAELNKNNKSTKIINSCSTDVYSEETKLVEYNELDLHTGINMDAKIRSLSESKYQKCLNIRADVIGKNLYKYENLLENILDIEQNFEFAINKNFFWNGLTALEYASIVENILINDIELSNVQHIFSDKIRLPELYKSIGKILNKNLTIKEVDGQDNGKILTTINPDLQKNLWPKHRESIETALQELKDFYEEE